MQESETGERGGGGKEGKRSCTERKKNSEQRGDLKGGNRNKIEKRGEWKSWKDGSK